MFTLARKIDIHYSTNKIILAIAILVGAIGYFITGHIKSGAYLAGGTFLTWALAREVLPRDEYGAFISVTLSLVNIFLYQNIQLLVLFWLILLLRLVNGLTGKKTTPVDIFSLLGLSIFLSISRGNSVYLLPFLFSMMKIKKTKVSLLVLPLSAIIMLVEILYFKYLHINTINLSSIIDISIIVLLIAFIISVIGFIDNKGVYDDKGDPADEKKIKSSQIFFAITIFLLFILSYISINNLIIYIALMLEVIRHYFIDKKIRN